MAWTVEGQPQLAISYFSRNVSFNFRNTSESPAAVDVAAMCHPHDENDEHLVEDFVDDAVVADTSSTQATKLTLQDTSLEWTLSQVVDRANDSAALSLRNASKFPGGALLDPNRVAHP